MNMKKLSFVVACAAMSLLGACTTLNDAQKLAASGGQASIALQNGATAVYTSFLDAPKMDALDKAYATNGEQAGTSLDPAVYRKIKTALKARVDMAAALGEVYGQFGELAGASVETDTSGAVGTLYKSVSALSVALGGNALSAGVGSAASAAAGLIASLAQRNEVLKTSRDISLALVAYRDLLKSAANRKVIVSLSKDAIGYRFAVLNDLWRAGLVSGDDRVLADVVAKSGAPLKLTAKPADYTQQNKAFSAFLPSILAFDEETQKTAVEDEYDSNVKLVDALIKQHEALEQGGRLDFTQIEAWATKLKTIAGELKPPATPKASGG